MSALICGSYAYDTIMVFQDQFKNHILPDKVHILNVSFLVPEMRREYGGCAGNIAYNLNMLGGAALPMATVGADFAPYAAWMDQCGISRDHIKVISNTFTGQAFITTDMDDNQITAFHPGAMSFAHQNHVGDAKGVKIGIVSPDGREGMIQHAKEFAESGIPFIFDPGQGLPMFDGFELMQFIDQASYVTVNDYEAQILHERTGLYPGQIAARLKAYIITMGGDGSQIYTADGKCVEVPTVQATAVKDPTGCGDAYRGGLLYGLLNDMDWETTARIASLMGALCVAEHGTQKHGISAEDFNTLFTQKFGYSL